jgi:hypothetical protein
MRLGSSQLVDGQPIPAEFALGVRSTTGPVPGANISPPLGWTDVPDGTQSFVILCVDPDAPTSKELVNRSDVSVPADYPRGEFVHWVLANVPAHYAGLEAGADSNGLVVGGKTEGYGPVGLRGLNDYTSWFADDVDMRGNYVGYDGPWPPFNDQRVHRYVFSVYALSIADLALPLRADISQVRAAMFEHVLAEASLTVTYSLNPQYA